MQINKVPTTIKPIFMCPGCGAAYDNAKEAQVCFDSNEKPALEVGDVLIWESMYTWHGDAERAKDFVLDKKSQSLHDGPNTAYRFILVVCAIGRDKEPHAFRGESWAHDCRYHLVHGALQGPRAWNDPKMGDKPSIVYTNKHHVVPHTKWLRRAEPGEIPADQLARVLEQVKPLMGSTSRDHSL